MLTRLFLAVPLVAALVASPRLEADDMLREPAWQDEFNTSKCNWLTSGRNPYFVLEPGFRLVLEDDDAKLHITVLDETRTIDGVSTRVVEEKEWEDGKLTEISMNYFAICEQTGDVFYFGEDVDIYKNGKVVKHEGTWHAGTKGSRAGLIMPGKPQPNVKYYQELAPGVAMDRAEIVRLDDTCKTGAGTFQNCLKIREGSAIETGTEYKYYAPGIGLVQDEDLRLSSYGFARDR